MSNDKYTPFEFGHKLGLMGRYAAKHLCQFTSRAERLEFCRGYSAGIDAAKRQQEVKRQWKR